MTPELSIVGLNHESASVELRERFALTESRQLEVLGELNSLVDEVVLLATCNRAEIIYHADSPKAHEEVLDYIRELGSLSNIDIEHHFYVLHGAEALRHLCRVACGIDSMVLGETQILGQCKTAFERSFEHQFASKNFMQLYQQTLQTAKLVRTETELGKGNVSISSLAVRLAQNIFEDLKDKRIMIIGAGEMCELAAMYFKASGCNDIRVVNRSIERADALARRHP